MGVAGLSVFLALAASPDVTAQEATMSTIVSPLSSGTAMSRLDLNPVKPLPATDHSLALPTLSLFDDGTGLRVRTLTLQMPGVELGEVSIASSVGDQRLPAVFRDAVLAGPALASPARGVTLSGSGRTPFSVSFGQVPVSPAGPQPTSPAFAAAAVSFAPGSRLSVTPKFLIPGGSPDAQRSVGTAIRANVVSNVAMTTDVGMAGTADTSWAPLASARLVGQWPRAGIETVVLRGAPAPGTGANTALVSSRDREAAQAQVQPLRGITIAALTSVSRPASDPTGVDTTLESIRLACDRLRTAQLAAVLQREATASREVDTTSFEWRQRGTGRMAVRFVRQSVSDAAVSGSNADTSRVELELPVTTPRSPSALDLRAALTAGSISPTDSGVSSKVSGRVGLVDNTALTGETEIGLTGSSSRVLRGLRLTTEMPVVSATRLQLSYAYRTAPQLPLGQVFEARIVRRVKLGW